MIKGRKPLLVGGMLCVFCLSGCQSVPPARPKGETDSDVHQALKAVAGALSGQTLSKEEFQDLEKQVRTDEDAQTAIQAITDSMGDKNVSIMYCPITGQRYAAHLKICPVHNVELKAVDSDD